MIISAESELKIWLSCGCSNFKSFAF